MAAKRRELLELGLEGDMIEKAMSANPSATVEELISIIFADRSPVVVGAVGPSLPPSVVPSAPSVASSPVSISGSGKKADDPIVLSGVDDDLSKAIAMSLKEEEDRVKFNDELKGGRSYVDPENPHDRRRESLEIPAGMKNVGNTCYINSLLQAMFLVPEFRVHLLVLETAGDSEGEKLIHELQLLFSQMLLTTRRYVDPTKIVQFTSHRGAQEDPAELFLALLEKIRDGVLKQPPVSKMARAAAVAGLHASEDGMGAQPMDLGLDEDEGDLRPRTDLVSRYFEGSFLQLLEAAGPDGVADGRRSSEKFLQVICSVPQSDVLHLHDLLDLYTSECLIEGYKTESGFVTQAKKSVMLEAVPPILTIQLQRVSWINNALQKNNAKVVFDLDMALDRYMSKNADATIGVRRRVAAWQQELSNLEALLGSMKDYKSSTVSSWGVLSLALSFLRENHADRSEDAAGLLERALREEQSRAADLERQIGELREKIRTAYDEFPRAHTYALHAILVHSGSPDLGGHYWAYMRDQASGAWFKFNDVAVTRVEKPDEMMTSSFGESGGATSATALVYVSTSIPVVAWNTQQGVPMWARAVVERDNAAFADELAAWSAAHPQEPSRAEKQQLYEAAMADVTVPQTRPVHKVAQFAHRRDPRDVRIVSLLCYDEVGLEPADPRTDVERRVVAAVQAAFTTYQRAIVHATAGLRRLVPRDGSPVSFQDAAPFLAFACQEGSADVLGVEWHRQLLLLAKYAVFKALTVIGMRVATDPPPTVEEWDRIGHVLAATLALPNDVDRAHLLQRWRGVMSTAFALPREGPSAVVRRLWETLRQNDSGVVVRISTPPVEERPFYDLCSDFALLFQGLVAEAASASFDFGRWMH